MTRPDILDVDPPQDESNYTVAAADFRLQSTQTGP
jgi:hypothetical protein